MEVVHIHNGKKGGVLNYINRVIHASETQDHPQRVLHITHDRNGVLPESTLISADSNKHWASKKFQNLVGPEAILICHDAFSLQAVSTLGMNNPTAMVVHGDYEHYYNLAKLFEKSVNAIFCVSDSINQNISGFLPNRLKDIYTMLPIVPNLNPSPDILNSPIQLAFIGRLSAAKGYPTLPLIDEVLQKLDIEANWHIIGEGKLANVWNDSHVYVHGHMASNQVYKKLTECDFLILPSIREGMPLSVLEAMSAKLVCLVNEYSQGVYELIQHGVNGFIVKNNDPKMYAEYIADVLKEPIQKRKIGDKAAEYIKANHSSSALGSKWKKAYNLLAHVQNDRSPSNAGHTRLDKSWLPNSLTKSLRKLMYE
jgi:glycosyltransferase involved in cell wall biosynthesis